MQHLRDLYSSNWMKIVTVGYFDTLDRCFSTKSSNQDCDSRHGCCSTTSLNWGYDDFVNFPKEHGFRIDGKYKLHESGKPSTCTELDRPALEQGWLFFKLIHCVIRNNDGPLLTHDQLVCERQLSTAALPGALNDWHNYMYRLHQNDQRTAIRRILEVNQILELAKQVVLANLAEVTPSIPWPRDDTGSPIRTWGWAVDPADERDLCIMILGETLSVVLARLMRKCHVRLPGWELDDGGGWGPPAYVSNEMSRAKWCPRSQATIKGQLGRNATLLYVTFLAHGGNWHNCHPQNGHPRTCTPSKCEFIEAGPDLPGTYNPSHSPTCKESDEKCAMIGPDEDDVLNILSRDDDSRNGVFPLMRVSRDESTQNLKVDAVSWEDKTKTPFATVSHVWSQGLGNRTDRMIRVCQLHAIQDLVAKAFGTKGPHLFWLDTFAIPQRSQTNERRNRLKRKAIGLIHHIFNNAQHCIIVDRHVMSKGRTFDSCRTIGAELLASGWMMRLWTLQEAFVSDQLHIALCDHNDSLKAPPSLNGLWKEVEEEKGEGEDQKALVASMSEMMRRKVDQNLMKVDSLVPVAQQTNTERALLIASAWKAVRYRTTRNPGEETLALSSLLDIPICQDGDNSTIYSNIQDDRERLMERFWEAMGRDPTFGSSIPPGIIFLPGKRLTSAGFRWAPATWMSGEVESYPFPLDNPRYPTELTDRGLIVHYPGFLLYPNNDKLGDIISAQKRNTFEFSVGRGLDEWYKVVSARRRGLQNEAALPSLNSSNPDQNDITLDLRSRLGSNPPLKVGIILSRPRPVEVQGETGLLVEIYDEKTLPPKTGRPVSQDSLFYCRIIRRVEVTRVSMGSLEDPLPQTRNVEPLGNGSILDRYEKFVREVAGVQLDEAQGWCVDGFAGKPPPPLSRRQTETPPRTQEEGFLNKLRRVWTGSSRLESADQ